MKRTTIMAEESLLLELKHQARREGKTVSELVREAIRYYLRRSEKRRALSFVGIGKSGRDDIAEKCEEILENAFKRAH